MHSFFIMSLFARNVFNRFRVSPIRNADVISNMVRLNRLQCYTCLTDSSFIQLETKKCTRLRELLTNAPIDQRFHSSLQAGKLKKTVNKILNVLFLIDKSKQQLAGFNWFRTLDNVNYNDFFTLLQLEDTYYSWFKITELHVWMLLVRLMQNGDNFRTVRTSIIEAMWVDAEERARTVEPMNRYFKKNMQQLYDRFKVTLITYDEGFLSDDIALASALWFHFFEEKCDDPRMIEALISYVRYQINFLQVVDVEREGQDEIIKQIWTSFKPHFEYVK